MNSKWQFLHAFWEHRTKLLVLVLILSLIASQPIKAQFGIDWATCCRRNQPHWSRYIHYDCSSATRDQ